MKNAAKTRKNWVIGIKCLSLRKTCKYSQRMIHDGFLNDEMDIVKEKVSKLTLPGGREMDCAHKLHLDALDGSAVNDATGMKGAYCTICKDSCEEGKYTLNSYLTLIAIASELS